MNETGSNRSEVNMKSQVSFEVAFCCRNRNNSERNLKSQISVKFEVEEGYLVNVAEPLMKSTGKPVM